MKKTRIKIVKLGTHIYNDAFEKLRKYKSDLFEVEIFEKLDLPEMDYSWGYSFETLRKILSADLIAGEQDLCIGCTNNLIEGNYFGKCLDYNKKIFVFSSFQLGEILASENIDVFNAFLIGIYRFLTNDHAKKTIVHDQTKGCLFDMCGIKTDIVYSSRKAILCNECERELNSCTLPNEYVKILKRELKQIKKARYYIILDFVKKHPILSIIIGIGSSFLIGLATNFVYDLLKGLIGG